MEGLHSVLNYSGSSHIRRDRKPLAIARGSFYLANVFS